MDENTQSPGSTINWTELPHATRSKTRMIILPGKIPSSAMGASILMPKPLSFILLPFRWHHHHYAQGGPYWLNTIIGSTMSRILYHDEDFYITWLYGLEVAFGTVTPKVTGSNPEDA